MDWNLVEEKREEAFELRNKAGYFFGFTNELLKAVELFGFVIGEYAKQIAKLNNLFDDRVALFKMNKEHLEYEKHYCLAIYNERNSKFDEAISHSKSSIAHIETAIKLSNDALQIKYLNEDAINGINYDSKRWTYYKEQNQIYFEYLLARQEAIKNNISKSIDYYKKIQERFKDLLNVTGNYVDVLEEGYQRIADANYLMMCSNYAFVLGENLLGAESSTELNPIIIEGLVELWASYRYSLESVKIFPEGDRHREVLKNQLKYINNLLLKFKDSWEVLLDRIGGDEFKVNISYLKTIINQDAGTESNDLAFKITELTNMLSKTEFYKSDIRTPDLTRQRIEYLKYVIENNDGYKLFYHNGVEVADEDKIQLLFKFVWFETEADVNREVNNGRGSVDYKVSKGASDSTLVEFKLARNSKLKSNLRNQVGIYEKANGTGKSFKVILYFSQAEHKKVNEILKELSLENDTSIYLIDARRDNKPSASLVK
ncbi:hypothetical protein RBB83_19485 [Paenibacillus peoriae]|uniref:hypothetical protein n=1 Tax=Paenibacillus peoriae TaxID=59893 RepID=UPI0030CE720F